jgi:hypothetical protein
VSRAGGLLLLALLGWHVAEKLQHALLPEMLWACHLATFLAAIGLLVDRPSLTVLGGMFHLVCGLPGWILEWSLNGTTPSSFALHVATPIAGVLAARRVGLPSWLALGGSAFWAIAWGLGRLCDPALNVNMAWRPYEVLPASFPTWASHALNLFLVAVFMETLRRVTHRRVFPAV